VRVFVCVDIDSPRQNAAPDVSTATHDPGKMLAALCVCAFVPLTPNGGVPSAAFVREAEIKHGRVAMLALPTLAAIAAATGDDPVRFLSHQPADVQAAVFAGAGALEGVTFARLGPEFSLKDGVVPGALWRVPHTPAAVRAEDLAGRAAMVAAAAAIAGSLVGA
jgi:hypothetical protein